MAQTAQPTHFVGIAGAGMSSLAAILLATGEPVSGCDLYPNEATRMLASRGAQIFEGHAAVHVAGAGRVITTRAASGAPDVAEAQRLGVPIVKRAALLGQIMGERRGVAVAGTHGKTTTTSLIAMMLIESGADPSVLIGGVPVGWELGGRYGAGEWFVAEADEFDRSFLHLHPDIAVVTSIEMDHPDTYADLADVTAAFRQFLEGVRPGGTIVVFAGDAEALALARSVATARGLHIETYGGGEGAGWRPVIVGTAEGRTCVDLYHPGGVLRDLRTVLPGYYNMNNLAGAIAAAARAGAPLDHVRATIESFRGVSRRWEQKGEAGGVLVIDDYAHHPAAVRTILQSARELYADRQVWIAFQPHTYSRTRDLMHEFAEALRLADRAYVLDVYAAREQPDPEASGERLAVLAGSAAAYAGGVEGAATRIAADAVPGVLVLAVGAGDVTRLGPRLLEHLRDSEAGG